MLRVEQLRFTLGVVTLEHRALECFVPYTPHTFVSIQHGDFVMDYVSCNAKVIYVSNSEMGGGGDGYYLIIIKIK